MKKKILAILVCMLVAIGSAFTVAASTGVEKQRSVAQSSGSQQVNNTLITELYGNRVIEVDSGGTIVWEISGLYFPVDAERLTNGNSLIAEMGANSVIEVDSGGTIVWEYTGGLYGPFDAERLANGNTLIADTYNFRVIEVDSAGTVVWEKTVLGMPTDAERLANGNTLIAEFYYSNRVIEVDSSGTIVWEISGLMFPVDVERLANGNTLITEFSYGNRVIEVNSSGTIVWEYVSELGLTFDAERLSNGNTLITEYDYGNRVIEVDSTGTIVWEKAGLNGPTDAERIFGGPNEPPDVPTIEGPSEGRAGEEYEFTFKSTDPDGDDVKYVILWGDDTGEETGYNPSGTDVKVKHTWSEEGEYIIKAKAVDAHGAESDWAVFVITIVENQLPDAPTIEGETSGKTGKEYEYTFNAVDPDSDDVRYIIDWGDNTSNMTDFSPSGTDVKVKHTWSEKGDYTITAYARDIYGAEGPEGTLTLAIPRVRVVYHSLFLWFFDRFPLLERLLNLLKYNFGCKND